MDAVTAALVGSLGGAAVGGIIGFVGTRLTIQAQADRDLRQQAFRVRQEADADARQLRDARRERLRQSYETLVLAAITGNEMVRHTQFVLSSDETVEARDARLGKMISEAWKGIDAARIALMLESDGREVLDVFDRDLSQPYTRFRIAYGIDQKAKGSIGHQEFDRLRDQVAAGVERVVESARARLDALQQVIVTGP